MFGIERVTKVAIRASCAACRLWSRDLLNGRLHCIVHMSCKYDNLLYVLQTPKQMNTGSGRKVLVDIVATEQLQSAVVRDLITLKVYKDLRSWIRGSVDGPKRKQRTR